MNYGYITQACIHCGGKEDLGHFRSRPGLFCTFCRTKMEQQCKSQESTTETLNGLSVTAKSKPQSHIQASLESLGEDSA